uniref:7TM GPCR serpentine receptor class x (Srx) domain-containing protein n=1 Tax=Panagrolaimus davidi TaxID=227884 RepID=A0A914QPP6_9BILA
MFGNAFSMFIFTVYLGPVCITQTLLFPSIYPFPRFIGFMFHAQWFQDVILTAFTAVNRWIVVVGPLWIPKITRKYTVAFIIFAYAAGILTSIFSTYIFYCCSMFLDYKTMTFAYDGDGGPNYADNSLDLPINITCFTISVLCYIRIYWFVKSSNTKIVTTLSKSKAENRKLKETKYALQFAACTLCAIVICVLFHVLPFFLPLGIDRAYIIYSFLEIIHSSANSLIFVFLNNEIRKKFLLSFYKIQLQSSHSPALPGAVPNVINIT